MADAETGKPAHPRRMELLGIAATFIGLAFLAALPLMALLLLADNRRETSRDR